MYKIKILFLSLTIAFVFQFNFLSNPVFSLINRDVKVRVIQYFPEDSNNPGFIDANLVGPDFTGKTIAEVRDNVTSLTTSILPDLTEASRFRFYKDSQSLNYLNYTQYGNVREYLEPLPVGNPVPWNPSVYRPDYIQVLNRENICDLVDNQGVQQVWLWGYHHDEIEPAESNMAMGTNSQFYWNHGIYGDVSNSEQTNDMPVCSKTYVLFNYNYARGIPEALEDHMHHLESILKFLNQYNVPRDPYDNMLFWNRFVGASGYQPTISNPGCGWTHYPPNGTADYDWYNLTPVLSDCMDWKPDGTGTKTSINCETWAGTGCQDSGGGRSFKVWWMQSIPGYNNGLGHQGKDLKNWWDAVYDFDGVLAQGGGLLMLSRGDINADSWVDLRDAISMLNYIFGVPYTLYGMDLRSDNNINMLDVIELMQLLGFSTSPSPTSVPTPVSY